MGYDLPERVVIYEKLDNFSNCLSVLKMLILNLLRIMKYTEQV